MNYKRNPLPCPICHTGDVNPYTIFDNNRLWVSGAYDIDYCDSSFLFPLSWMPLLKETKGCYDSAVLNWNLFVLVEYGEMGAEEAKDLVRL